MSQLLTVPTWTFACGRAIGQARRPLKLVSPSQSSENRPQRSSLNGTPPATVREVGHYRRQLRLLGKAFRLKLTQGQRTAPLNAAGLFHSRKRLLLSELNQEF